MNSYLVLVSRSRVLIALDVALLLAFLLLNGVRFSGLPVHEWLGVVFVPLLLVHLEMHWPAFAAAIRRHTLNDILNLALFVLMTAATVSGVAISKVLWPASYVPAEFMKWRSIHEGSANGAFFVVAVHIGLNWHLVLNAIRRRVRERFRGPLSAIARQTVIIALAAALAGAASFAVDRVMPADQKVELISNGKRTIVPPPRDVVILHRDEARPNFSRWDTLVPRAVALALLAAISGSLMKFVKRRTA
ncbi:MAG TPA: DUF4405 domain-containing protein [Thermoanaerobaculia bacterium]|jgi:hypothetical protein|nr:DUF4405 domain-containing protein [Thermoanaerobaculia bacterium]